MKQNIVLKRKTRRKKKQRNVAILIITIVGIYFFVRINEKINAAEETENAPVMIWEIKNADGEETKELISHAPDFIPLPVDMTVEDQEIVFTICKEQNVAFSLVMAIIGKESEFAREARSTTGDSGYMQINDCNADELARRGYTDLFDTEQNIGAGVSILRELFDIYEGDTHRVLMAYNMGKRRAAELWAQGIETSEYSCEILEREAEYSRYMDAQKGGIE